jgi:RNA polymerase sigma-70 factor, ECF subfamily
MTDARFEDLYRRYGPVIFVRCRRLLGDPAAAEDATQETFLRIHSQIDRVPTDREALLWIYRVATNHCLDLLRRRTMARGAGPALRVANPERIEDLLADRELVRKLLTRAAPREAEAAALHYFNGLAQGEVAEVLGVARRTVVKRLSAFVARSRELLKQEGLL